MLDAAAYISRVHQCPAERQLRARSQWLLFSDALCVRQRFISPVLHQKCPCQHGTRIGIVGGKLQFLFELGYGCVGAEGVQQISIQEMRVWRSGEMLE